jgi:hypothetical protein
MSETPRRPRRHEPSDLDHTLDAALREMVAGEGPADLRRRVLARIGEAPRRPPVAWPALAAAAGIAVTVVAGALLRTASGPEAVRPRARPSTLATSAAPPAPARAFPVVAPTKPAPPPLTPARPRRADEPPEVRLPLDFEAGVDVEPIELAPLAVVPISGEHIDVTALTIERMEIEPLAEPQP